MEAVILELLRALGSVALFLYGMRIMSEALLKVGNARMRNIMSGAIPNRFVGLLTGIVVTAIIQSSSATTILVVNLVNAGLLSLSHSISIIMGANIGTTVTGWIVAFLGFQFDITYFALPAIGVALVLAVSKVEIRRAWGEFIIGLSLMLLGISLMRILIPPAEAYPLVSAYVHSLCSMKLLSLLIFIVIGGLLTVFFKSSSTTMAVTIVLCMQGWFPFEMAVAMTMGQNLGTTITANMAAAQGNIAARRAARAHFLFNMLGVIWALAFFHPFVNLVDHIGHAITGFSVKATPLAVPISLALFHTLFNTINALVFIWFTNALLKVVMWLCPAQEGEEEEFHLRFISAGLLATPEQSMQQARKEVIFFARHTSKLFTIVRNLVFEEKTTVQFQTTLDGIAKYESMSDQVTHEIANYLLRLNRGKTTEEIRTSTKVIFHIIDELESITDGCFKISTLRSKMRKESMRFPIEINDKLQILFTMIEDAFGEMCNNLDATDHNPHQITARSLENRINQYRDQLRAEHLENLRRGVYRYDVGVIYVDIIEECENVADFVTHISEALGESESK